MNFGYGARNPMALRQQIAGQMASPGGLPSGPATAPGIMPLQNQGGLPPGPPASAPPGIQPSRPLTRPLAPRSGIQPLVLPGTSMT